MADILWYGWIYFFKKLNWIFHTDNNQLYYNNRTLKDRFPETAKRWKVIRIAGGEVIKSILKGNLDFKIHNIHVLNSSLISCDGFGNIKKVHSIITDKPDHYYYYIDHYWSKSTEEFVNKLIRGSVALGKNSSLYIGRINIYFKLCDITIEKINYIENKTNVNLTRFKLLLKNNTKNNTKELK